MCTINSPGSGGRRIPRLDTAPRGRPHERQPVRTPAGQPPRIPQVGPDVGQGSGGGGQQGYGQQGYGYPAAPPVAPAATGKDFFAALFDFSFSTFVTPSIIKVLYILITVFIGLGYFLFVITSFSQSALAGLAVLVLGAVGAILYLALARVFLEFYMAVFRLSDDVQEMKNQRR